MYKSGENNISGSDLISDDGFNENLKFSDDIKNSTIDSEVNVDKSYIENSDVSDSLLSSDNIISDSYYLVNSISDFNGKENLVQVEDNLDPIYSSAVASNCYFVSQDFTTSPSSGENFTVTFLNTNGFPICGKELSLTLVNSVGGTSSYWSTTNINGVAKLPIFLAFSGIYSIKVLFGGDKDYGSAYASYKVTIATDKVQTVIYDSGNYIVRGNSYKITLKDIRSQVLTNEPIYVSIINSLGQSKTYLYTTNSNGVVNMPVNLIAATWTLSISYKGSANYESSSKTVKLTVTNPNNVYPNTVNNNQFKRGLNERNTISDLNPYITGSNRQCSRNSNIVNLANSLTKNYVSTWDKTSSIFNWVRDNIKYEYPMYSESKHNACGTLLLKKGNCCDQANLVVALCRASNIPVKYTNANNCYFYNSKKYYGHVWAQIYSNGNWYSADTTGRSNKLGDIKNWNINKFTLRGQYSLLSF